MDFHDVLIWVSSGSALRVGAAVVLLGISYAVLRRPVPRRSYRLTLAFGLAAVLYMLLSWSYLMPAMPDWLPVPPQFQLTRLRHVDQWPLQSAKVYEGRYTCRLNYQELTDCLRDQFTAERGFGEFAAAEGSTPGMIHIYIPFRAKTSPDMPLGGCVEVVARAGFAMGDEPTDDETLKAGPWQIELNLLRTLAP